MLQNSNLRLLLVALISLHVTAENGYTNGPSTPKLETDRPHSTNLAQTSAIPIEVIPPSSELYVTAAIDSCRVMTNMGLVDLSPLDSAIRNNKSPRFSKVTSKTGSSYSYNPCTPFVSADGLCMNVAVCQHSTTSSFTVGTQGSSTFFVDPTTKALTVMYEALGYRSTPYTFLNRVTYVTLKCNPTVEGILEPQGELVYNSGIFYLTLISKFACPRSLPPPTTTAVPTTSAPDTPKHHDAITITYLSLLGVIAMTLLMVMLLLCALLGRLSRAKQCHKKMQEGKMITSPPPYIRID